MSDRKSFEKYINIYDFHKAIEKNIKEFDVSGSFQDNEFVYELLLEMSKSDKRELKSRLITIIQHKLKWDFQPKKQSKSWEMSVYNNQNEIELMFDDSPSLMNLLNNYTEMARVYKLSKKKASRDTGIPKVERRVF